MSKQCLSHYHLEFATWTEGQNPVVDSSEKIDIAKPNKVVLYETAHSGHVLLTGSADPASSPATIVVTDPEIYVKIRYGDGKSEYVSAPLATSLEFSNVASINLHITFLIGPPGWKTSHYSTLVNAHAIYEISH